MTTSEWDPWNFRHQLTPPPEARNLIGFTVHATDGEIGKVDDATIDADESHLVVDTGAWIFGRRVLLPAGTVERIDWDDEVVYVDLSKDEIKDSPEFTGDGEEGDENRANLGAYFVGLYTAGRGR